MDGTSAGYNIHVENLSYFVSNRFKSNKKQILRNVSLTLKPGTLTALMGPSGAGKSTLLDLLANRKLTGEYSGRILFNSSPRPANFGRKIAYILQDDLHIGALTVRETIYFSVSFKTSQGSQEYINKRVSEMLEIMNLAHVADHIVGDSLNRGISGGELKRLSIAVEIASFPSIIFLDEPTSGLDSRMAAEVIQTVKKNTYETFRTSIATVHQPSAEVFALFDKIVLLAEGRIIFFGDVQDIDLYFCTSRYLGSEYFMRDTWKNPAEFILEVCEGLLVPANRSFAFTALELHKIFQQSDFNKEKLAVDSEMVSHETQHVSSILGNVEQEPAELTSKDTGLFVHFHKFRLLFQRNMIAARRDYGSARTAVISHCLLGVLVGITYYGAARLTSPLLESTSDGQVILGSDLRKLGGYYSAITYYALLSNLIAMPRLLTEHRLFRRELASESYSVFPYWLMQVISYLPTLSMSCAMYIFMSYCLLGFDLLDAKFFFYQLSIYLFSRLAAYYCIMFIVAVVPEENLALNIYSVVSIVNSTFDGYCISPENLPALWRWMPYINFSHWTYSGFMVNALEGRDEVVNGESAMSIYDIDGYSKFTPYYILAGYICIFLAFIYYALLPPSSQLRYYAIKSSENIQSTTAEESFSRREVREQREISHYMKMNIDEESMRPLPLQAEDIYVLSFHRLSYTVKLSTEKNNSKVDGSKVNNSQVSSDYIHGNRVADIEVDASTPSDSFQSVPIDNFISESRPSPASQQLSILQAISGRVESYQMCALMGASGAGKTTLLDLLAQSTSKTASAGQILVTYQGRPVSAGRVRRLTAYVKQDLRHLSQYLTVEESFQFAIGLLRPDLPADERACRVEDLLLSLRLEHVRSAVVGGGSDTGKNISIFDGQAGPDRGISGGERRRLAIGMEIIHHPQLIFLDEPTTGLDSVSALETLQILRNFADAGRMILCTIHQPSPAGFELFDKLLLVHRGELVYYGDRTTVTDYFAREARIFFQLQHPAEVQLQHSAEVESSAGQSPLRDTATNSDMNTTGKSIAEWLLEVISGAGRDCNNAVVTAETLVARFQQSLDYQNLVSAVTEEMHRAEELAADHACMTAESHQQVVGSLVHQLQWLWWRERKRRERDRKLIMVPLIRNFATAIIYGTIFYQISTGVAISSYTSRMSVFNVTISFLVLPHSHTIAELQEDRVTFYHERSARLYSTTAYFVNYILTKLVKSILLMLGYSFIVYYFCGLRTEGDSPPRHYFVLFWYLSVLVDFLSMLMCFFISNISPTIHIAYELVPVFFFFQLNFEGFLIFLPSLPPGTRWLAEMSYPRYAYQAYILNEFQENDRLPLAKEYLRVMGFDTLSMAEVQGNLCIFLVTFLIASALTLNIFEFKKS